MQIFYLLVKSLSRY